MSINKFNPLYKQIQYQFNDVAFLKQALTHCSASTLNYERLEFLGDSILSVVIATQLYQQFPDKSEGELSRLRAYLVKGETLAEIAAELNLGDYLYLGQGELKSGGFRRASILADALEAVFAAVFLDGGMEQSKTVILHLYRSRLEGQNLNNNLKDAKTQLQEFLQAHKYPLPSYVLTNIGGEEHEQEFQVFCEIPKLDIIVKGNGATRRKAEQLAAKKALNKIKLTQK